MPSRAGDVYFVLDQMLGHGDEVVEDVLLLLEHARLVPRLAVFGAAAHAGGHPDAAALEPRRHVLPVRRQHADREPAVAVEHRRVAAVERQRPSCRQEERHARAVLGGGEQRPRFEQAGVDRRRRRLEALALSSSPGRSGRPSTASAAS